MDENITIYEEFPLFKRQNSQCSRRKSEVLKGPLRVLRLCLLGILIPCFLSILILYLRYRVYVEQMYPLAMSDMRMLDSRISTTWCQRQKVRVNATYNAYLLSDYPNLINATKPLSMIRHLSLEDDTKEYWGFYLLRGSVVTISPCVRWPGASLIVIRGHKHLHECAYIGDNSSEELDELMEALNDNHDDGKSNEPLEMLRHRIDVQFHHQSRTNSTSQIVNGLDTTDITDPKQIKELLALIKILKKEYQNNNKSSGDDDDEERENVHVHRNSTVAFGEQNNFRFVHDNRTGRTHKTESEEVLHETIQRLHKLGPKGEHVLAKLNRHFKGENKIDVDELPINTKGRTQVNHEPKYSESIDKARRRRDTIIAGIVDNLNKDDNEELNVAAEVGFTPDGIADHRGTINETTLNDRSNSEFWSSFSSSEEALLNCAGLILNLPLTPHKQCNAKVAEDDIGDAYFENTVTYKVPVNGYYFFVFNSENEVDTNYIRVKFNIQKTQYNISNPVSTCMNSNDTCTMDLKFFSNEKLIMELPIKTDKDLWNEEFVVISDCEPRTALYVAFVVAIPVLVILFAFQ